MAVDVQETDDSIIFFADVPGLTQDNLKVQISYKLLLEACLECSALVVTSGCSSIAAADCAPTSSECYRPADSFDKEQGSQHLGTAPI